jgi:hypothetical protein
VREAKLEYKMSDKEKLPNVAKMKNYEYVSKYDDDVSTLVNDYNRQVKDAKDNATLSDIAFLDIGKKLLDVQKKISQDIKREENKEDDQKVKKVFAAFKLRVAEQVNKNISNVDKVYKVAQFCETETYEKYKDRLPSGWGTLYLLLSFKKEKDEHGKKEFNTDAINELMSDFEVTKDIKRSKLIEKIDAIKTPNRVVNKKVTITINDGKEPTQQQLNELQMYLKKKFKQWEVTAPEIKGEATRSEEVTKDSEENQAE